MLDKWVYKAYAVVNELEGFPINSKPDIHKIFIEKLPEWYDDILLLKELQPVLLQRYYKLIRKQYDMKFSIYEEKLNALSKKQRARLALQRKMSTFHLDDYQKSRKRRKGKRAIKKMKNILS